MKEEEVGEVEEREGVEEVMVADGSGVPTKRINSDRHVERGIVLMSVTPCAQEWSHCPLISDERKH